MSYYITIGGHTDSKEAEAKVLAATADHVEAIDANGSFGFAGQHFSIATAPAGDAVAAARKAVADYNATADADDKAPEPFSEPKDTGEVEPDAEA